MSRQQTCMLGRPQAAPGRCPAAQQQHLLWKVIPSEQKLCLGSNFSVARVLLKNCFHFRHKMKCKCPGTAEFRADTAQLEGTLPRPLLLGQCLALSWHSQTLGCGHPRKKERDLPVLWGDHRHQYHWLHLNMLFPSEK